MHQTKQLVGYLVNTVVGYLVNTVVVIKQVVG
jgi:hypothetical protein